MTISPKLSPRLRAAAELVRPNAFVSDVGTDHAYLPIALCLEGKIRGGVVSDINQGPIDRAKDNIYIRSFRQALCRSYGRACGDRAFFTRGYLYSRNGRRADRLDNCRRTVDKKTRRASVPAAYDSPRAFARLFAGKRLCYNRGALG